MSEPAWHPTLHRAPLQRVFAALLSALALLALMPLLPLPQAEAQVRGDVVISEIFYNPDGQAEGHEFIELHNTTSSPIDVSGWQFLTGITYAFPAGATIDANSYLVLAQNAADFEAVFGFTPSGAFGGTLSNGGENITLVNPANVIIDQVIYDDAAPWPLSADGDDDSLVSIDASLAADDPARWVAGTPTPQVANDPVLNVIFSTQRGWYSATQTVTLRSSIAGATIYYNTTGNGAATIEYTGPITVPNNGDIQVIQAQALRNGEASPLRTHTYVFKPDTGAPVVATWPNGLAVAPDEDEVTRSFEFIPPPSTGLAPAWGNAGVKLSEGGFQGGDSDKFFFRGTYGNSTLTADLFGDNYYGIEPTTDIDQLFLRAQHGDPTHLRQIIAQDALLAAGQLSPHGRFVEYYRDGDDAGVRHMQERPEGGFMESYTGIDKDFWLAWSTHEERPGTGIPNGLGGETLGAPFSSWSQVTSSIDVDSLVDYLLVQWQSKVSDYRSLKNFRIAGPTNYGDGTGPLDTVGLPGNEVGNYRFHFFNWDMDLGYMADDYGRGGPTGWGWAGYASPDYLAHELDGFIEFRLLASDRIACAHFDGGVLTAEAFAPRIEARRQELIAAGGANASSFTSSLVTWLGQRNDWLLDEYRSPGAGTAVYGSNRPNRAPWKPPTSFTGPLLQQDSPLGIDVSGGVLSITNPNGGQVYYRLDGGDPRLPDGSLSPDAIAYNGPASLPAGRIELIARSFDAAESDSFQAWSPACNQATTYDIAVSGEPGASPGDGLVITEIQYNPDVASGSAANAEFIELLNTTDQPINASGFTFSQGFDFAFPIGTTIQPGEYVTLVPSGAASGHQVVYADAPQPPPPPFGEFDGRLDDAGETITLIDAVGGTVDTVSYDDAAPWPTTPDGDGFSLALVDPSADNNDPASWMPSLSTGTPGHPNDPGVRGDVDCDGSLSINDALLIAQYGVGLRTASATCPLDQPRSEIFAPASDFDGSGAADITDSLFIAQCSVGLPNPHC